jgi:hypothetical protein
MKWRYHVLMLACTAVAGCAEPSRNLYEGIRMHNESMQTPEERANTPPTPSYDEYKKERDKLKNGDSGDVYRR